MRTFYSLPNNYSGTIQEEIHQLIYHTDGGYSWYHVYNHMPVHFRKFHLKKTQEMKEREAEQMENGSSSSSTPASGNIPDSFKKEAKQSKKKAETNMPDMPDPPSKGKVPDQDAPSDFDIPDDIPKSGNFEDLTKKDGPDVNIPSPDKS